MASPNSKTTLKDYALRQLGAPVIEINVDDDQVDDVIDDCLQYYKEFHYDGAPVPFLLKEHFVSKWKQILYQK